MVSGTKFFVHGGGRWRELDTNDGCVEGWGKAKIVYRRHGKLVVAKTQAVLSGLRDLAAGHSGLVRDGSHLPFIKTEDKEKIKKDESLCNSSQCCQHANNRCLPKPIQVTPVKKVNIEVQCTSKIDAGIQTSQTLLFPEFLTNANSRKRRRDTTSSDENVPTKNKTKAVVHIETSRKSNRAISDVSSDVAVSKKKVPRLTLEKADSEKYNLYKRRRSNSSESIVWVVVPKNKDSKTDNKKQLKSSTKQNVVERELSRKRSSKCTVKRSEDQSVQKSFTEHKSISQPNVQTQDIISRQDQCKELIIDDNDVVVLRNYLLHNTPGFDLLRFDEDDDYKKHFFFKINPLVNVERCPKIARLLKLNKRDDVSLNDFASMLGLMSVSTKVQPKRYKMRKLKTKRSYIDSVTNKENSLLVRKPKMLTKSSNARDKVNEIHESNSSSNSEIDTDLSEDRTVKRSQRSDKSHKVSNTDNIKSYKTRLSIEKHSKSPNKLEHSRIKKTVSKNLEKLIEEGSKKNSSNEVKISSKKAEVKAVLLEHKTRGNNSNSSNSGTDEERKSKKKLKKKRRDSETSIEDNKMLRRRKSIRNKDETIEISESSDDNESVLRNDKKALNLNNSSATKNNKDKKFLSPQKKQKTVVSSDSDEFVSNSKPSYKGNKTQIRKDSTSDNSDFVNSRSSRIKRDTNKVSPKINKVRNRKLNDDKSRDNTSANYDRRVKNKANNKPSNIINSSSEEKSPSNRISRVQNKKNRDTSRESSDEDRPSNNDRKVQSKANKEIVRHKQNDVNSNESSNKRDKNKASEKNRNSMAESSDDNSPSIYDKRAQNSHKRNKNLSEKENVNTDVFKNSKNNRSPNDNIKNRSKNYDDDERNLDKFAKSSKLDKFGRDITEASGDIKNKQPQKPIITKVKSLAVQSNSISKRPLSTNPYSNLEDHAIVTWISSGGRACCVNGNRIWRELQDRFKEIAGQKRSWHSLRNRYLRYILPALGSMALPIAQVSRLRAAASTGEIKARKQSSRRNSIFQPPERGALSRRPARSRSTSGSGTPPPPKRHKHDHTARANPPSPRTLRSSQPSPTRTLRYSDITRHFAETHRHNSTSNSPTPKNSPKKSDRNTTKNSPNKVDKNSSNNTGRISSGSTSNSDGISMKKLSKKSYRNSSDSSILESKTRNSTRNVSTSDMKSQSQTSVNKARFSLRKSFRLETLENAQKQAKSPGKTRKLFNPASLA